MFPMRPAADDAAAAAEPARKNTGVQRTAVGRPHALPLLAATLASRRCGRGSGARRRPSFLVLPSDNVHCSRPTARPYYRGLSGFKASMDHAPEAGGGAARLEGELEAAVGVGWTDAPRARCGGAGPHPRRRSAGDRRRGAVARRLRRRRSAARRRRRRRAGRRRSRSPCRPSPRPPSPCSPPRPRHRRFRLRRRAVGCGGRERGGGRGDQPARRPAEVASKIAVGQRVENEAAAEVRGGAFGGGLRARLFGRAAAQPRARSSSSSADSHADSEEEEGAKKGIEFVATAAPAAGGGARARRRRRGGGGRGRVPRRRDRVRRRGAPPTQRAELREPRPRVRRRRPAAGPASPRGPTARSSSITTRVGASSRAVELTGDDAEPRHLRIRLAGRRRRPPPRRRWQRELERSWRSRGARRRRRRASRAAAEDASAGDELPSAADGRALLEGWSSRWHAVGGGGGGGIKPIDCREPRRQQRPRAGARRSCHADK